MYASGGMLLSFKAAVYRNLDL